MFRNREQLDVRVTHFEHVRNQRLGELEKTEGTISPLRFSPPRTEMHFVDRHRRFRPILFSARFQPVAVGPYVALQVVNERRGLLAPLIEKRERITLEQKRTGLRPDLELVVRALTNVRQK